LRVSGGVAGAKKVEFVSLSQDFHKFNLSIFQILKIHKITQDYGVSIGIKFFF